LTTEEESSEAVSTPFAASKDSKNDEDDDDDDEINFKTPKPGPRSKRISDLLETPGGLDIEKLRPRPLNLVSKSLTASTTYPIKKVTKIVQNKKINSLIVDLEFLRNRKVQHIMFSL
jgi:hypothetical protein